MQKCTISLLGVMLLVCCLGQQRRKGDDLEPIRTRRLSIVNDKGVTVVEIFGDERGGFLSLRSKKGKELVTHRIDEHGGWIQVSQHNGRPGARMYVDNYTGTKTAGLVETWDAKGETAVVLGSGDEEGRAVSMGADVRGGVLGLFRDGKQHLLDPLKLDEMKAALRDDDK